MKIILPALIACSLAFAQSPPVITAVTSAAPPGPPTMDGLGTIWGENLADGTYSASTRLYQKLGSTMVFLCRTRAPLESFGSSGCLIGFPLYASPSQVNFFVSQDPHIALDISGSTGLYVNVWVNGVANANAGDMSQRPIDFYRAWPSIFPMGYDCNFDPAAKDHSPCGVSPISKGKSQVQRAAIIDQSGTLVSSQNPARMGRFYSMYLTGLGLDYRQTALDAYHAQAYLIYFLPLTVGNMPAGSWLQTTPYWAGESSYAGLQQVNLRLPDYSWAIPCGEYRFEVSISFSVAGHQDNHNFDLPVLVEPSDLSCAQ